MTNMNFEPIIFEDIDVNCDTSDVIQVLVQPLLPRMSGLEKRIKLKIMENHILIKNLLL